MTGEQSVRNRFQEFRHSTAGGIATALTIAGVGAAAAIGFTDVDMNTGGTIPSMAATGPTGATAVSHEVSCPALTLANTAFKYTNGRFLPVATTEVTNNDQASKYVRSWFGASGPLAAKADRGSLAAVDSAIAAPALETNTNNSYDYQFQFTQDMSKLENPATDQKEAETLCADEYTVLGETFGYDGSAIAKGEQYTAFTAIEGRNDIDGLKLEHKTASQTIGGATFKVQNQGNQTNLHGFTEVIVQPDGEIDVLGYLPTATNGSNKRSEHGKSGKNPQNKQPNARSNRLHNQSSTPKQSTTAETHSETQEPAVTNVGSPSSTSTSSTSTSTNRGGGSSTGTSTGTKPGKHNPEHNKGPAPGKQNQSPQPGPTSVTVGPKPTPGPGGSHTTTTPGRTTTTETVTTPAQTVTTETVTTPTSTSTSTSTSTGETTTTATSTTATTSTETTGTTTTSTSTSTGSKGSEPTCVPNPPYVICPTN